MNIKHIIDINIAELNVLSTQLVSLLKKNKVKEIYKSDTRELTVTGSIEYFSLNRMFNETDHYSSASITTEARQEVDSVMNKIKLMLPFMNIPFKLNDMKKPTIINKIYNQITSKLDKAFCLSQIDINDIKKVYNTLDKKIPVRFVGVEHNFTEKGLEVRNSIKNLLAEKGNFFKEDMINHYSEMAIETLHNVKKEKAFEILSKKYKDLYTIGLLYSYMFNRDKFNLSIQKDFDFVVDSTAFRICDHVDSEIEIKTLNIGVKGFDVIFSTEFADYNARSIAVEGLVQRFHYRYIITKL